MQYYNGNTGDVLACPKTDEHYELLKKYEKLTGKAQTLVPNYSDLVPSFLPAKILVLTNEIDKDMALIKEEFGFSSSLSSSQPLNLIRGSPFPFFAEVLCAGVSKGDALKSLVDRLGIPMDAVMAFGDGDNDCEMLRYSGDCDCDCDCDDCYYYLLPTTFYLRGPITITIALLKLSIYSM
jgi:hydroxymethylpyrimidine pyrophosphatase-like HAD family hydrolase